MVVNGCLVKKDHDDDHTKFMLIKVKSVVFNNVIAAELITEACTGFSKRRLPVVLLDEASDKYPRYRGNADLIHRLRLVDLSKVVWTPMDVPLLSGSNTRKMRTRKRSIN